MAQPAYNSGPAGDEYSEADLPSCANGPDNLLQAHEDSEGLPLSDGCCYQQHFTLSGEGSSSLARPSRALPLLAGTAG